MFKNAHIREGPYTVLCECGNWSQPPSSQPPKALHGYPLSHQGVHTWNQPKWPFSLHSFAFDQDEKTKEIPLVQQGENFSQVPRECWIWFSGWGILWSRRTISQTIIIRVLSSVPLPLPEVLLWHWSRNEKSGCVKIQSNLKPHKIIITHIWLRYIVDLTIKFNELDYWISLRVSVEIINFIILSNFLNQIFKCHFRNQQIHTHLVLANLSEDETIIV